MDEHQRAELFELWKCGAPFPQLASVVDGFIQDAAHASARVEGELTPLVHVQGTSAAFFSRGRRRPRARTRRHDFGFRFPFLFQSGCERVPYPLFMRPNEAPGSVDFRTSKWKRA
jgi:hypothetical protein